VAVQTPSVTRKVGTVYGG